jgi:hypothetical protein
MKRFVFLAIVVGIVLVAQPAGARNDPFHTFLPPSPWDLDASYCGFPIHVDQAIAKVYARITTQDDGTTVLQVNGVLRDVISSPTTTITLDSSGPAVVTIAPDGATSIVGRGHGVQQFTADQQEQTGLPGLVYFTGLTKLHFDADGTATLQQASSWEDLCARLA